MKPKSRKTIKQAAFISTVERNCMGNVGKQHVSDDSNIKQKFRKKIIPKYKKNKIEYHPLDK